MKVSLSDPIARPHATRRGAGKPPALLESTVDLSALGVVTAELAAQPMADQVERVLDRTNVVLNVEAAEIFLREPGKEDMLLSYLRGGSESAFTQIERFHLGDGYPGRALASGEAISTLDLRHDEHYLRDRVKDEGFRSYLVEPIQSADGVIGVLNVATRRENLEVERAARLLNRVAACLAPVLDAASLRARLAALTAVAESSAGGGLDALSLTLLERMMDVGGASAGELIVCRPALQGTLHRVTSGVVSGPICRELRADDLLPCPAFAEDRGWTLAGTRDQWPVRCRHLTPAVTVVHCVPLIADGDPVGIVRLLYGANGPRPATKHLAVLHSIAAASATILGRARYSSGSRAPGARPSNNRVDGPARQRQGNERAPTGTTGRPRLADAGPASPALDARCLGTFELFLDGQPIPPGTVRRRSAITILKMLIVSEGGIVTRDAMAEAMWPDAGPDTVANRIHVLIHALRQAIEDPGRGHRRDWTFIRNDGDRYYLNPDAPYRSDVNDFRRFAADGYRLEAHGRVLEAAHSYQAALRLYTGDLLADEPYAEWCWAEREYLRETALDVVLRLAIRHTRQNDLEKSISLYRRALRIDSLREEVQRGLISTLIAAGRRTEAVRQYQVYREALHRELGVDPLPETRRLLQGIANESV